MPWDPERHNQFQAERAVPFEDLFSLVKIRSGMQLIDLGCGSGELTASLAKRFLKQSGGWARGGIKSIWLIRVVIEHFSAGKILCDLGINFWITSVRKDKWCVQERCFQVE